MFPSRSCVLEQSLHFSIKPVWLITPPLPSSPPPPPLGQPPCCYFYFGSAKVSAPRQQLAEDISPMHAHKLCKLKAMPWATTCQTSQLCHTRLGLVWMAPQKHNMFSCHKNMCLVYSVDLHPCIWHSSKTRHCILRVGCQRPCTGKKTSKASWWCLGPDSSLYCPANCDSRQ